MTVSKAAMNMLFDEYIRICGEADKLFDEFESTGDKDVENKAHRLHSLKTEVKKIISWLTGSDVVASFDTLYALTDEGIGTILYSREE